MEDGRFKQVWKASYDIMYAFVADIKGHLDSSLFPRQHFMRDQSCLFVQDLVNKMYYGTYSAARFREGLENLYYLMETVGEDDVLAAYTLSKDLVKIVQMAGVLTGMYETAEGLQETCWYSVAELLRGKICKPRKAPPLGKYKYFKLGPILGAGGFGAVYRASFGNISCVLKFVPPSMMPSQKHALADKQVASMINHPCLVRYYATFMTSGAFVTCMEYIQGIDLTKLVKVHRTGLPVNIVQVIVAQLGLAIQHLHFKGFIHRDVKPDNIMVFPGCRIKLIDFDTCKVSIGKYSTKHMPSFQQRTSSEFSGADLAGTIPYMPPEMFKMTTLGRSMDWWAVGVLTFEMSTGQLPFRGSTEAEIRQRVLALHYGWPHSGFPYELMQFVSDCMNPDTATRLCSRHYLDFQNHDFFKGVDFHSLETASFLLEYSPIDEILNRMPGHQKSKSTESSSPGVEQRRARLFPNMNFKDVNDQRNMYCYSSPGFVRCINLFKGGEEPSEADIMVEQEFLKVDDEYNAPYTFEQFAKVKSSSAELSDGSAAKSAELHKPHKIVSAERASPIAEYMSFVKVAKKPKENKRQVKKRKTTADHDSPTRSEPDTGIVKPVTIKQVSAQAKNQNNKKRTLKLPKQYAPQRQGRIIRNCFQQ